MMVFIFLIIIILFILLSFVWPPDSPWSPWWRTNKKAAITAGEIIDLKKSDVVYELGSGDGEFILTAASIYKVKKAIGIEIDYTRFLISKIRNYFLKFDNADFVRADFKKVNISDATVVYFYLVPAVIKRILPRLKKELKPGTKVISYRYKVPLKLIMKKGDLYYYKI